MPGSESTIANETLEVVAEPLATPGAPFVVFKTEQAICCGDNIVVALVPDEDLDDPELLEDEPPVTEDVRDEDSDEVMRDGGPIDAYATTPVTAAITTIIVIINGRERDCALCMGKTC